jgi:2-polyprenyl-6-methoxyphenol hydroxylase-like FAD-dependent oxidoreductase
VVGGGIVGAAFACGLGISSFAKSKKIIVIESGNPTSNISILPNEYSNRVSSITSRSFSFLNGNLEFIRFECRN